MIVKSSGRNGYCMMCRQERNMAPPAGFKTLQIVTMRNGKPATEGRCPVCGTRMFRLGRYK
jgi:hypothetical protein